MIPKRKAWLTILLSVLVCLSLTLGFRFYYRHVREKQLNDPNFRIVAIAQANRDGELLKNSYLAEVLGLSVDRPTSLLRFDTAAAERILKGIPLIKEVQVSKIKPGTVSIEYQLRKPIAFLGDYSNTALDNEGFLFPFHPFYTPKKLPEIWLGVAAAELQEPLWGQQLKGARIELALHLQQHLSDLFSSEPVTLNRIDLSNAYSLSYGQRQIVVQLEERMSHEEKGRAVLIVQPRTLRLGSANWVQGLKRYMVLRSYLAKEELKLPLPDENLVQRLPLTIDLRVPRQALYSIN